MVRSADAQARLFVLCAALCFGTTGTAQELGRPDGVGTLAVGSARIIVGAALLALIARRAVPLLSAPVLLGGVGVAVYQLAFFAAVDETGVAVGTVVAIGSGPAIAGLLGRLVNGSPLTGRWALATALAGAGVALLALAAGDDASVDPGGIGLAVLAGAGYAGYTVLAKRLLDAGHEPVPVMAATFGMGAVLLVPVLLAEGVAWLGSLDGLLLALYLGAIPTALAYALFARGLRRLSAGETATITLAEPLTATLLGALVLGERPGGGALVGAGLVLAGLLVLALPGRRAPATAETVVPA